MKSVLSSVRTARLAVLLAPLPALALAGLAAEARAQVSWSGGTSSNWFTGSNWSGGTVPGSGDSVVVNSGTPNAPSISGTASVGSLSGSGTVTIGASSSLTTDTSGSDTTFSGSITGDGEFDVDGGGALTLTGTSHITDALYLCSCAGTLTIDGGSFTADSGTFLEAGTLAVTNGGSFETLDLINDGAAVQIEGSGSVLTVNGDTEIGFGFGGTLTVSDGALVKSLGGAEVDSFFGTSSASVTGSGSRWEVDGTLSVGSFYNGIATLTVADGAVVKATSLIDIGPYGELRIGDGGLAGELDTPEIGNDGQITADFSDSLTLSADISGDGSLVKKGDGTLTLTGTDTYSDTTRVLAGTLIVDGSLTSPVRVGSSGTLGGSGSLLGGLVNSGTVAPGNSIGTLTVEGDVVFKPGSTYQVEVDPTGSDSDLIHATGEADLEGGTVVHVGSDGSYRTSATYTILTADGGVSGSFDGVRSDYPFLDPTLSYDANNVYLKLTRNDRSFSDVAVTTNHKATAPGVESLGAGNKVYDAVSAVTGDSAALDAFDALSGDLHASVASAGIEQSRLPRQAVSERLQRAFAAAGSPLQRALAGTSDAAEAEATPPGSRTTTWVQAFGAWGSHDSDGNAAAADQAISGVLIGADRTIAEHWRLGLFAGYDRREVRVKDSDSSASADSVHLGAYGGARFGALGFAFGASYTRHAVSTSRAVVFTGFDETDTADYGAATEQLFGQVSYSLAFERLALEPYAGLAFVRSESDSFEESGGDSALRVEANDHSVGFGTLGGRAATRFTLGSLPELTASGSLGWRHTFGELAPDGTAHLEGGGSFTVYGLPLARDVAVVGARLGVPLTDGANLTLAYGGQFGDGFREHGVSLDLLVRF